jgi:methionyl-tRNA formyltransferase
VGLRVVLISQIQPAMEAYVMGLRALGHEPVGLLCVRTTSRYGFDIGVHVTAAPPEIDVVMPASRERIAPLLRALEPDLALCAGFPWKLPADALEVPRLGVVNFHPSLLPRYRGPIPVGWAIRNGDREIGVTFHRMAAELDTGPILSQGRLTLGDEWTWDELGPRIAGVVQEILPAALERAERSDPGDPQDESAGEYLSFFEPAYAEIDWSRSAAEVERQVRAWRFGGSGGDLQGALTELEGERVRVLRVSLEPGEGRPVECGDGTVWVLETEPVPEA